MSQVRERAYVIGEGVKVSQVRESAYVIGEGG